MMSHLGKYEYCSDLAKYSFYSSVKPLFCKYGFLSYKNKYTQNKNFPFDISKCVQTFSCAHTFIQGNDDVLEESITSRSCRWYEIKETCSNFRGMNMVTRRPTGCKCLLLHALPWQSKLQTWRRRRIWWANIWMHWACGWVCWNILSKETRLQWNCWLLFEDINFNVYPFWFTQINVINIFVVLEQFAAYIHI